MSAALGGTAALCLIVLLLSEALLRLQVVPQDVFFQQVKLYRSGVNAEIVTFGDSHMSQGLDLPEGGLNMAMHAESFEQTAQKLRAYLATHARPKLVVLEMEPHMFAAYRQTEPARDYAAFFGDKFSLQTRLHVLDPALRAELPAYWTVFLRRGFLHAQNGLTPRGSVLSNETWTMPMTPAEAQGMAARAKEHALADDFTAHGTAAAMRETLRFLKGEHIPVCVVAFPVAPLYRETIGATPQMARARALIRDLAAGEGVPYFSYFSLYDDYSLYRNPDHLNAKGARLFTKKVLKDCGGQ